MNGLFQNREFQIGELLEALVEGYDFEAGGLGKGGEVGVGPKLGRKLATLRMRSPGGFQARWFVHKLHSRIGQGEIIQTPRFNHVDRLGLHDARIVRQPQEGLLCMAAEVADRVVRAVKPSFGRRMRGVSDKRQGQPEVYVRKVHSTDSSMPQCPAQEESRRSCRSSSGGCLEFRYERAETRRGVLPGALPCFALPRLESIPLPMRLPEAMDFRQALWHRSEFDREVP